MTAGRGTSFVLVSDDLVGSKTPRVRAARSPAAPSLAAFLGLSTEELLSLAYRIGGPPILERNHPPWTLPSLGTATLVTALAAAGVAALTVPMSVLLRAPASVPRADAAVAIGISTTFVLDATLCSLLVEGARACWPARPVVLGGAGVTLNPEWFTASGADLAIVGDGDEALPALLDRLAAGSSPGDVPGLMWRDASGSVRSNPRHDVELRGVPTPRFDLVTAERRWPTHVLYESVRGCPYRCRFCSYPQQSPSWRVKSAAQILDDFAAFAAAGVRHVGCHDSTMLAPRARIRELARLMVARGLRLTWDCLGHPGDVPDDAFAEDLYAAGCRGVFLGVESGSEAVLRNMGKHATCATSVAAATRLARAGVAPWAFVMIGFPGETRDTVQETVALIEQMPLEAFRMQPFEVRDARIPVLRERERFGLTLRVLDGEVVGWEHPGMDSTTAQALCVELHVRLADGPSLAFCTETSEQAGVTRADRRNPDRLVRELRKDYERYLHRAPEAHAFGARPYKSAERAAEHRRAARDKLRAALRAGELCAADGRSLVVAG